MNQKQLLLTLGKIYQDNACNGSLEEALAQMQEVLDYYQINLRPQHPVKLTEKFFQDHAYTHRYDRLYDQVIYVYEDGYSEQVRKYLEPVHYKKLAEWAVKK